MGQKLLQCVWNYIPSSNGLVPITTTDEVPDWVTPELLADRLLKGEALIIPTDGDPKSGIIKQDLIFNLQRPFLVKLLVKSELAIVTNVKDESGKKVDLRIN
jgi:hypothetical protein